MLKRALSLIICIIMLTSTFVGTGITASANNEIVDEVLSQAQAEPIEEASALEIPTTTNKNTSVVVPDTVTATYSGTCGDNLTWSLDTFTGVLSIDGTGNMYNYYEDYYNGSYRTSAPWKSYISYFESVVIGDSVTSIGNYAFSYCESLTSVTIGDSVTSIGYGAFEYCTSLTNVTIPDSVMSIGGYSFHYCDFTSVTLGNSVTSIGEYAFCDCDSITSMIIPDSVKSIGDSAFADCRLLASVTIGNSVTSIGEYAFDSCFDLTSINIPDSVTSIGYGAFVVCRSLKSVSIPDSVTSIGDRAFVRCTSLESITVDENNQYYSSDGYGALYNKDKTELIQYPIGKTITELIIPESVTSIGDSAFADCSYLTTVIIPDSVISIGNYAFDSCFDLTSITIGDSVTSIGYGAFDYCAALTIKCFENSYAHTYAIEEGFAYELYCDHMFSYEYYPPTCTEDAYDFGVCDHRCGESDIIVYEGTALGHSFTSYTLDSFSCTEGGSKTACCDNGCGLTDVIVLAPTAEEHTWSEWITTVEPTYTTEGKKIRFCYVCNTAESVVLPVLVSPYKPVISVDNFKVTITNAELIEDMRYAPGEYTTTTEIRNAEGNVAISEALVVKYTVDGSFVYEMPNAGYFTIWIRMKDGTSYIMPLDVTKVTPSVSSYGVRITLHNLFNVKDFYIAKGEYQTYREIKDNGYIVSISGAKIGTKHDYTYTVYEPGVHTVLVRYNDGTSSLFHETLVVDEPVFATNGLQVTVSNLPDVRVIRTAYGEWNTVGELKATDTIRNFSAKTAIKGKDPYTIQYREDGVVTVIVEYNNGYQKVFHYEVKAKQANCVHNGSTVLFNELDGFVMIRYAMGEYTTAAQIKRASGSKVIKPADLSGEYAIVSGLEKGTYTFCVQFDDESYDYYTVTVE